MPKTAPPSERSSASHRRSGAGAVRGPRSAPLRARGPCACANCLPMTCKASISKLESPAQFEGSWTSAWKALASGKAMFHMVGKNTSVPIIYSTLFMQPNPIQPTEIKLVMISLSSCFCTSPCQSLSEKLWCSEKKGKHPPVLNPRCCS